MCVVLMRCSDKRKLFKGYYNLGRDLIMLTVVRYFGVGMQGIFGVLRKNG